VYSYLPALLEAGIEGSVSPFLSEAAFRRFYRPGLPGLLWKAAGSVGGLAKRSRELSGQATADAVVIHREAVPRGNRRVFSRLRDLGLPVLYDLDDAIYMAPRDFVEKGEDSRSVMTRGKVPGEVDFLLKESDAALVGNEVLAAHAREVGAKKVVLLPTPVDTETFRPDPSLRHDGERPLVGWIGSPTATYCLRAIAPALSAAARRRPFRLLVVGASGPVEVPGVEVIQRDWALDREAEDYASLDVGLYPLPDNPWTRGKCGYKALLYAASGAPCIASPVGVNLEIVKDGETGFHAADDAAWEHHLVRLLGDADLRASMGAAGRRLVEERYAVPVLAPILVKALKEAVAR
jgi:glycosyltransferase involved in cell wall biosynthesis